MALIEAQRPRAERSSLVRTAAEGFAAALAGRLTAMTGREVDVRLEGVSRPDRAAPPDPRSAAIFFECLPHDGGAGTLRIGGGLLQPCLDLAMGGCRGNGRSPTSPSRPATAIEARLTERLARCALVDLRSAFAPLGPFDFRFVELERRPRAPQPSPRAGSVLLFRFTATLQGGGGAVDVLMPASAIDGALRLRAGSPSEVDGDRGVWARRLAEGVRDVDVEVEAVLHERTVSIGLASNLAVGGTLALGIKPDVAVVLRCGAVEVATATVASREDQLVLAVTSDNGEVGAIP